MLYEVITDSLGAVDDTQARVLLPNAGYQGGLKVRAREYPGGGGAEGRHLAGTGLPGMGVLTFSHQYQDLGLAVRDAVREPFLGKGAHGDEGAPSYNFV